MNPESFEPHIQKEHSATPDESRPRWPSDAEVLELLMPWPEYSTLEFGAQGEYWAEKFEARNGQQLRYIGAQHVFDPKHPEFELIDEEWTHFLNEAKAWTKAAIYEGRFAVGQDKESTITSGGESAYVRYLAKEAGIETVWPEPTREEEAAFLQEQFSTDQIISFYCLRAIYQWHRLVGERPSIDEYLKPYLPKPESTYETAIHTTADFLRLSPEIFGEQVYVDRRNSAGRLLSPREDFSPINDLARTLSNFRDVRIVKQLVELWSQDKSLFMVYGNAHLIRQRRALEVLLHAPSEPASGIPTEAS